MAQVEECDKTENDIENIARLTLRTNTPGPLAGRPVSAGALGWIVS
jgi:hypothetical protein